jgi:serine/threonine protein kinase
MANLKIGRVLCGQYRVDQHLASTGMSDVYKVWDIKRNVPLAMKVLSADLAEDPSMLKRFKREAQALKNLNHPNIVPFYGLFAEDDLYFLLELFIDGPNLKDILHDSPDRRLSISDTLTFMKVLSSALGYAHANKVVHCDIKPGNAMVDSGGTIYLTDFGIARHSDSSTTTNVGAGTAAYMAPEQILEETVSPATDVYAMGIMVYEMLAGRRPFRGDDEKVENTGRTTEERLRNAHLKIEPPDPRKFGALLNDEQVQVIIKAMKKKPGQRYETPGEFFEALCAASAISPETITARFTDSRFFQPPEIPSLGYPEAPQNISKPNKIPSWFVVVIGVVVIGLFIFIVKPGGSTPEGPTNEKVYTDTPSVQHAAKITDTVEPTAIQPTKTEALAEVSPQKYNGPIYIALMVGNVGDSDIYVANADGSNLHCVACEYSCDEAEPAWAPDGKTVIYQSNCAGSYDIWSVDINGNNKSRLTSSNDTDEREASWSSNNQIAYRSSPANSNRDAVGDILIMNIGQQDGNPIGLQGRSPAWSPDGNTLSYMSNYSGIWQIFTYSLSTYQTKQVTNCKVNCRWPNWSPDGKFLTYNLTESSDSTTASGIAVTSLVSGEERIITTGNSGRPSWSNNGWISYNTQKGIEICNYETKEKKLIISESKSWGPIWSN